MRVAVEVSSPFMGKGRSLACLFFPCFIFDCVDVEFWGFLLRVSVREVLRAGTFLRGRDVIFALPRLPMDLRTSPAFFDALYPLRRHPVWPLCPYPSSLLCIL
jgi:hypothetical protein